MKDINYFKGSAKDAVFPEEEKIQKKLEKKHEKFKRKARLREVKKALLGNLEMGADSRLKPCEGINPNWWGTTDGSFGTRLFGITEKSIDVFAGKLNKTQAVYRSAKAMEDIGRGVDFETVYEGCACIVKHLFFRPVVLIFEYEDDIPLLTAYCGRDVLTAVSVKRAIKLFKAGVPEAFPDEAGAGEKKGLFKR